MKTLTLLVGPPGSGKSTLARGMRDMLRFTYINQDSQGKAEHFQLFTQALEAGDSIVVDRMNFDKFQRKRYLEPAKALGYKTEIVVLHVPRKVCFDRCMTRLDHETIKDASNANSALNTFFSKYERPLESEADVVQFTYPIGDKPLAVICDLDGTLCNLDARLHHVRKPPGEKKNWKAFFDELVNDTPHLWCETILRGIDWNANGKIRIVYASGRPDDHERPTRRWLEQHALDFQPYELFMRCRGDHRDDTIAKEIILDFEILTRFTPLFFIDDRKRVVDLWRSRGYTCLACHEGDF